MTQEDIARYFLENCNIGNCNEVFSKYIDKNFKHHNPYYKSDAESLKQGMVAAAEALPDKTLEILNVWPSNDKTVISRSLVKINKNHLGVIVVHVFKFNNENKIEELWDINQPIPDDLENELGMI